MFKRTEVSAALAIAFGGALAVTAMPGVAQQAEQKLERVEITGSSVKRIPAEGALPVLVLSKEDIQRTGVTSTVDLLRKLPTVQGSTGEAQSVGGSTFGFSGVSIHGIGEERTLVLLNGHRLTLFGGQTLTGFAAAFDLNSIPVSAIQRVEVLTDGASAIYGSDAIAGVVNFITRRDVDSGEVSIGFSNPSAGAKEKRLSILKGFGTLDKDGYNLFMTYARDERTNLFSTDRDFAKTGQIFFNHQGKRYRMQHYSPSPIPANVLNDAGNLVSPYLLENGVCPEKTFRVTDGADDYCGFDFVGELEIYPERTRDAFMASYTKKIGDQELLADLLLSRTTQVSRIAPVPGGIAIEAGTPLHDQYLAPHGITGDSVAFYRVYDLGKRVNDDKVDFGDLALGSRGRLGEWDYNATYTHSISKAASNISGYPGALAIGRVRDSGLLDPFVGPGQQSPEAVAALQGISFNGYWDGGESILDTVAIRGTKELATLSGGPLVLGTGVNMNRERFQSKPSLFAQGKLANPVTGALCDPTIDPDDPDEADQLRRCDQRFGDEAATVPYSANRKSYGAFVELVAPVAKEFELSAAARYDDYSDFGSAITAKETFRWTPSKDFLVRGSVGTGFHAPTVPQVNAALQPYGVTSNNYTCTTALQQMATSLGAVCQPGNRQYDQFAGGNSNLQPEKSFQAPLGFRAEPATNLSVGADLWHVAIRDAFGQITEDLVFANPQQFPDAWTTKVDTGTGVRYLAFLASNQNLGKEYSTGLDIDITGRGRTELGRVTSNFTMTYMIRQAKQLVEDGEYFSSIGNFAELGEVTFRWQGRWATTLEMANWAHTLGINFKSGYADQRQTVDVVDDAGNVIGQESIRLEIPATATVDWQSQWNFRKDMNLTLGLLNLFDVDPPLSLATSGLNKGQQFGYDDRYYDPRGRTLYATFTYRF